MQPKKRKIYHKQLQTLQSGPILEEIWMCFLPRKIEAAWGQHKGIVNF